MIVPKKLITNIKKNDVQNKPEISSVLFAPIFSATILVKARPIPKSKKLK